MMKAVGTHLSRREFDGGANSMEAQFDGGANSRKGAKLMFMVCV